MFMLNEDAKANYDIFQECLSGRLIERLTSEPAKLRSRRTRKDGRRPQDAVNPPGNGDVEDRKTNEETKPEELAEFIEVPIPFTVA